MEMLNGQKVDGLLVMRNKNDTISVSVSVLPREDKAPEIRITTRDIIQHLTEKKIEFLECVQSAVVTNTSESRFGTWIFTVPAYVPPPSMMEMLSDKIALEIDQEVLADMQKDIAEKELDEDQSSDVSSEKPKRGRKAKKETD